MVVGRQFQKIKDIRVAKAQISVENDLKKRDGLIREALLINTAELPVIPLHQPLVPWAMRKNVDAVFTPNNVAYFFRFKIN